MFYVKYIIFHAVTFSNYLIIDHLLQLNNSSVNQLLTGHIIGENSQKILLDLTYLQRITNVMAFTEVSLQDNILM